MENGHAISRLMEEYGSLEQQQEEEPPAEEKKTAATKTVGADSTDAPLVKPTQAQGLMQQEERLTGSVSWSVYAKYFKYAGGLLWFPFIILCMILAQGSQGAFAFNNKIDRRKAGC